MPKIAYIEKRIGADRLAIIDDANRIIESYAAQGYNLTLRQLYYQFIGHDLFPDDWIDEAYNLKNKLPRDTKNTIRNYKLLCDIINDARYCGLVDWEAVVDRTRETVKRSHWESPAGIIETTVNAFGIDLWRGQPNRVEVWVEKEAMAEIVGNAARKMDCPSLCCRGYTSSSEMWEAAMRMKDFQEGHGQTPIVIHLGDLDPSGVDMTTDIQKRLSLFCGFDVEVDRIALNLDQVRKYKCPPNPAKTTDCRCKDFVARYGVNSWELDALEPRILSDLITKAIKARIDDRDAWAERVSEERTHREFLRKCSDNWDNVVDYLETL